MAIVSVAGRDFAPLPSPSNGHGVGYSGEHWILVGGCFSNHLLAGFAAIFNGAMSADATKRQRRFQCWTRQDIPQSCAVYIALCISMNTSNAIAHVRKVVPVFGSQHSGWGCPITEAHRVNCASPIREELFDIEVRYDGKGYLLCYSTYENALYGDSWHPTELEAKHAALEEFGVQFNEWQHA
jgi:hypothetical protein